MITVEVRLSAALREHLNLAGTGPLRLELAEGATLSEVYAALGLDPARVAFVTVNNAYPEENHRLQDGDRVRAAAHAVGGD